MEDVFLLWHVREHESGTEDEKLIGVYRSESDARAAVMRLSDKPGFGDCPSGFEICKYRLNEDNWAEGFGVDHLTE